MRSILLMLVVLTGMLFICDGEKKSSESSESSDDGSDESSSEMSDNKQKLSVEESLEYDEQTLLKLDKELHQEMKKPTDPELGQAFVPQRQIFKKLRNYKSQLKQLYTAVNNNTMPQLEFARDLEKQNGPEFLRQEINEKNLARVYNWDDELLDQFRGSIQEIKDVWNNITIVLKEKPSPMDIYLKKN